MTKPEKQLNVLISCIDVENSSKTLDEKLHEVSCLISQGMGIDNCRIYISDPTSGRLVLGHSSERVVHKEFREIYGMGEGLVGHVAQKKVPVIIDNIAEISEDSRCLLDGTGCFGSYSVFPVTDDEQLYGVITLCDQKQGSLTISDAELYKAISHITASIFRDAHCHNEVRKSTREFSMLYDISTAMMTTIKLDRLIHVLLTAVTIGDGLGFNRALLFLINDRSQIIQGIMGVGPDSYEEAWRIWGAYAASGKGLLDLISSTINEGKVYSSRLNEGTKSIRLPLDSPCTIARTYREQIAFNIVEDEHTDDDRELSEKLDLSAFATVPLIASGKVVGVILVDNYYNKRPIMEEELRFLTMFANQAGLAIGNSLLYADITEANLLLKETHEKLLQSEKLAALGEMAANVAHEIRNPLTTLGGFARRLFKSLEGRASKRYAEIMVREVDRLEKLLTDILVLSKRGAGSFKNQNINKIIEATIMQFNDELKSNKIKIVKDVDADLPKIRCDSQQLKQVFINFFNNSIEAINGIGTITIKTYQLREHDADYVAILFSDTGCGIPEATLPDIFNPFFTTKDEGTGLGLSIIHRIISHHHGDISVRNIPGEGAAFLVKLPVTHDKEE